MKFAPAAIVMGSLALLLALVHFWGGPFSPQPKASTSVAEMAVEIRDAAKRAVRGEPQPAPSMPPWTLDKTAQVATAVMGGLAIILAAIGFAREEPTRIAIAGGLLGSSAIVFQFVAWLALGLIMALLVAAVLQNFREVVGID